MATATPKPLTPDFHGTPGPSPRSVARAARDAGEKAEKTEPQEPPKELPKHTYASDTESRKRRVDIIGKRIADLEDQRFNAELDWDMFRAQLETMLEDGTATEDELKSVRTAERQSRIRAISLDAALVRMGKRKV